MYHLKPRQFEPPLQSLVGLGSMGKYSGTRRGTRGGTKKRPARKPAGDALPDVGSGASHQPSASSCSPAAQFSEARPVCTPAKDALPVVGSDAPHQPTARSCSPADQFPEARLVQKIIKERKGTAMICDVRPFGKMNEKRSSGGGRPRHAK